LIEAGMMEILQFVTHENALASMTDADVLLFIRKDDWVGRIAHGNKLFEYLAMGRPILAIAPPGDATRLITSQDAGLVAAPDDVPAIVQGLRAFLTAKVTDELSAKRPDPSRLRRFHRRELAGQLARLLDRLHACRAAGSYVRQEVGR
jgi:glycosyltransferase involved in cell wall biosynthesis